VFDQAQSSATAGLKTARPNKASSRPDTGEYLKLHDILHFFKRNLLTIAAPVAIALLAMTVYLMLTQPIYRADAQLLIDAKSPQFFREQLGEAYERLDSPQIESQMAIIRSEQIALAVIRKMNLPAPSDVAASPRDAPGTGATNGQAHQELSRVVGAFQGGLRVRRLGPSYVIEVSYHSADPGKAFWIANATAEAYIDDQLTSRAKAARQGSQWLEERIDELRIQMNAAALKVQEFKAKRDYRIINKPESGASADQQTTAPTKVTQITLEELESTAQTYRKIYESYLQAHTESVQRQSYPVTNARIITRTSPIKSHPKVLLFLLLALAVGAMVGLAIALIRGTNLLLLLRHMRAG
jgi:uncharacterized protein involved in exopolysaccharide biosynthesis